MTKEQVSEKMLICPKKLKLREGIFNCPKDTVLKIHFNCGGEFDFLLKLCGFEACKREPSDFGAAPEEFLMTIGKEPEKAGRLLYKSEEAFGIVVESEGISVFANTKQGFAFGLKALARMISEFEQLPCMEIQDEPSISFRGLHLCIFNPLDGTKKEDSSLEAVKKLLLTAALSGYNYAVLEFWGMFPYEKHPYACWPHSEYTRETVTALISFIIDDLHMTPIPCQNLTSHAGWSRIDSRKHVVLDQRPDLAPMWVPGGWCFATENPDTKAFLTDIMEDLIKTFRNPPFFHVDSDKCFGFGSTEVDRTKPADALFIGHLCFLNDFLQSHSVKMVMWGDMLYSSMDSLYWKPNPIISEYLPKNIAINIWTHNDPGKHWHDVDFFQDRGFETIYSPFLNKKGIQNMINLCDEKKSLGILQTTWHKPQTAVPCVVYSGGLQWCKADASDAVLESFIGRWYKII